MTRRTIGFEAAWMRAPILMTVGKPPSRRFWSRWMNRAFAPHEREMAIPHQPIAAIDIVPEATAADTQSRDAHRVISSSAP